MISDAPIETKFLWDVRQNKVECQYYHHLSNATTGIAYFRTYELEKNCNHMWNTTHSLHSLYAFQLRSFF